MRQRFIPKKTTRHKQYYPSLADIAHSRAIADIQLVKDAEAEEAAPEVEKNGFNDFAIVGQLKNNIFHKGYTTPTPIQDQAIPPILQGKDVIGVANTGTGKTAAFLIPILHKVFLNKAERVLIITPTRELAVQILEEMKGFSKGLGITSVLCIGGMSLKRQEIELRGRPHIIIGTPGRLKDLIGAGALRLAEFHTIVLDEVDRMVDIGFIADIKYFISLLPQNRQSLFFSATVDARVRDILHAFVHNAVTVSVAKQEVTAQVEQDLITVPKGYSKIDKLHDLLTEKGFDKVLLFGRTKWGVHKLTQELIKRGFKAGEIHGNRNQNQRQRVLEQFKKGDIQILLATDVASRGLDIPDVTHVINYEMPASREDYVHRIGRTGRADKKGIALTFVDESK